MILCVSVPELLEHLDQVRDFSFGSCSGYISCSLPGSLYSRQFSCRTWDCKIGPRKEITIVSKLLAFSLLL